MLVLILLIAGILFRFLPHAPNFTPVAAIALFGASMLPNKRLALILPVSLMMLSDLGLGLHDVIVYTWGATVLISIIGVALRSQKTATKVLAGSLISSTLFYLVTNFGVWHAGLWYPTTPQGLVSCYAAAIPFFRTHLASTLVYSVALFGAHALATSAIKRTRLAAALLTK